MERARAGLPAHATRSRTLVRLINSLPVNLAKRNSDPRFASVYTVMHLRRAVQNATRSFASHSSPGVVPNQQPHVMNAFQVFDRNAKKLQKDRSVTHPRGSSSTTVDYLRDEVADRLMERLHVRPTRQKVHHNTSLSMRRTLNASSRRCLTWALGPDISQSFSKPTKLAWSQCWILQVSPAYP